MEQHIHVKTKNTYLTTIQEGFDGIKIWIVKNPYASVELPRPSKVEIRIDYA
jgi:hypothetical protein